MGQGTIHGRRSNVTVNAKIVSVSLLMAASVFVLTSVTVAETTNTTCPVLGGNLVDKNIFTDYKDKKVFFCCQSCKTEFKKNSEKYLSRLPQFGSTTTKNGQDESHAGHDHATMRGVLVQLIKPIGILTLSLVGLTVALGVLRRRNPRLILKIHKICGVSALVAGATHATLIIFLF